LLGLHGIGAVAIEALEHAPALAAGRQRKDQEGPAMGAGWSFSPAHEDILKSLISNCLPGSGLKFRLFQIRPLRNSK
jgi:hypothetical protein